MRSTFTDGAGHFTQKLADEAARVIGYTTTPVSAVQFRDAGVKGTLSVVNDPTLGDFKIRERDSQIKITSENRDFCILKVRALNAGCTSFCSILTIHSYVLGRDLFESYIE